MVAYKPTTHNIT